MSILSVLIAVLIWWGQTASVWAALQTIKGGMWFPMPPLSSAIPPALASLAVSASGAKVGIVTRAPKSGTLDRVGFRTGAITTFPANGIRVSFQDMATDGNPDGTQDQYRDIAASPGANAWVTPGLMTSDGTDTGTKRSVTGGDRICIVIEQVNSADAWNMNISANVSHTRAEPLIYNLDSFPDLHGGVSWAKQGGSYPILVFEYSDGSYETVSSGVTLPVLTWNTRTFNNGSTPDERALFFRFPVQVNVNGGWVAIDRDAAVDVVLYDSDGTSVLTTVSGDASDRLGTAARIWVFSFPEQTLAANTDYRLSVKPTSASNVTIYDFDVNSNALLDAVEGGKDWYTSTRTDAGSWTQTTTNRPLIGLRVSAIHDGAGGGAATQGGVWGF